MSSHPAAPQPGEPKPARARNRTIFRVLGVVLMVTAIALIAIALADFLDFGSEATSGSPFDTAGIDEGPTKFWMFFLAMPFFMGGAVFLNLGFAGAHARYMAGEYSPAIRSVSRDLGMRPGTPGADAPGPGPYCSGCGTQNDAAARFCDSCGASMGA